MLDFGAEVFQQASKFDVPLLDIQHLFVTHSHEDHLYLQHLLWRTGVEQVPPERDMVGPRFSPLPMLHVYGNADVCALLTPHLDGADAEERLQMRVHRVTHGVQGQAGDIIYLPLEANHKDRTCSAVNYVLQREGRTILYALDTGWFHEHTYDWIKQFHYDLVVIEGTFGYGGPHSTGHFNLNKLQRAIEWFREDGLLKDGARFCASHISPHFSPVYEEYAPVLAEKGITLAYDGMKVDL
jgi:phosphoribosyl 1,2-cyclic phosphate phosphodiesterase